MRTPAKVFTEWGSEPAVMPVPISGISAPRLEALLESIMLERHWPSELDSEAIEAVLAALQSDEIARVKGVRPGRSRSAKVAVSTLAGLASVSTGAAAASTLAGPAESLGARILDDGGAVAYAASASSDAPEDGAATTPDHDPGGQSPENLSDGAMGGLS